jgi:hypothetical protein
MGDSSLSIWFSVIPLLIIATSIAAAVLALRSRRRVVRAVVAFLLIIAGAASILFTVEVLFSIGAGVLMIVLGVVFLILSRLNFD